MNTRVLSVHQGSRRYGQMLRRLHGDTNGIVLIASGTATARKRALLASRLARDLDRPLYRIDLTRIVSKYIGETEKNLSKAFGAASQSGAILFLDEADALFAKRGEVKDAHDRYANLQRKRILNRLASWPGTSVLATIEPQRPEPPVQVILRPDRTRVPIRSDARR